MFYRINDMTVHIFCFVYCLGNSERSFCALNGRQVMQTAVHGIIETRVSLPGKQTTDEETKE